MTLGDLVKRANGRQLIVVTPDGPVTFPENYSPAVAHIPCDHVAGRVYMAVITYGVMNSR